MESSPTELLSQLSTPPLADACIRLGIEVRCGPSTLRPVTSLARFVGPCQPVQHTGSVDIIFEAIDVMVAGAVLVIDDDARSDRACIGDLTALEAHLAGSAAMVVNGLHRDTDELHDIPMPVFSLGSSPTGPLTWEPSPTDALDHCRLGPWIVTRADVIIGDRDGVLIVPANRIADLASTAATIRDRERRQAANARTGATLRHQFEFETYLARRDDDRSYTFRQHLTEHSASIEE